MNVMKYSIIYIVLFLSTAAGPVWAQENKDNDPKPGLSNFVLSGSANLMTIVDAETFDETVFGVGWLPIFLWSPSDRLLFEGHLHIEVEAESGVGEEEGDGHAHGGGGTDTEEPAPGGSGAMVMLGYANLIYIVNDYVTFTAGQFLSPFGTYQERFHPAWVNKLPDAPLGLGHHNSIAPADEVGAQLRGGIPFGKMKMNYSVYVSNGPVLFTSAEEGGKLGFDNFADNNRNKAIGSRIGLLPLSNSSVEVGMSVLTGKVGSTSSEYEDVTALLYGGDISFFKSISGFGDVNIKGQYIHSQVDEASYLNPTDSMRMVMMGDTTYMMAEYTFDNQSNALYAQISYRPSKAESTFLKNLEFVVRYDAMTMPKGALWADNDSRYTFGIDYWLEARSAFKFAYQIGENQNLLMAQFVIGF